MFFFFFEKILPYIKLPVQVYHYTNAEAFLGILGKNGKNELWASHILFQNDKKEAIYAFEILKDIMNTKKRYFEQKKLDVYKIIDYIQQFVGNQVFTISFSEKRDDLNQWRGYANSTPAYCIGFLSNKLNEININNAMFYKCIYGLEEQKNMIENLVDYVIEKLDNLKEKEIKEDSIGEELLPDFLMMSALFKDSAFSEEKEWRLVFSSVNKDQIHIRVGNKGFVPYVKIPISKDFIKDIIIGPCAEGEYELKATMYVCSLYGIEIGGKKKRVIENSNIPFRK